MSFRSFDLANFNLNEMSIVRWLFFCSLFFSLLLRFPSILKFLARYRQKNEKKIADQSENDIMCLKQSFEMCLISYFIILIAHLFSIELTELIIYLINQKCEEKKNTIHRNFCV